MATIIEELGIVLLLAADCEVTGVVVVIWLGGLRTGGRQHNGGLLTSRIEAIQPEGGVLRTAMGPAWTAETAARATRASETSLNMAKRVEGGGRER